LKIEIGSAVRGQTALPVVEAIKIIPEARLKQVEFNKAASTEGKRLQGPENAIVPATR
jgi:hypothetical protein